jgi:hypothetical protein
VLELLAVGHSDAEIATALCISPKTANTHVCAIMTKLGVHNRTQAAAHAPPTTPVRGLNHHPGSLPPSDAAATSAFAANFVANIR